MKRIFTNLIVTYIVLTLLFTISIIGVHCIPKSVILPNIKSSIEVLQEEGIYKDLLNYWLFKLDNYTDALMFNIAILADDEKPIESAMLNYRSYNLESNPIESSILLINKGITTEPLSSYGRYWHGSQLFLRPILIFLDYNGIRILNYILFTILIVICYTLIKRNISKGIAVLFLLSLLMVNFPMIPISMQFSACFYIAMVSIVLLLSIEKLSSSRNNLFCTFFVIGACTSFFDLLTTPIITLGFPLIFYSLKTKDNRWQSIIIISVFWGLGYATLWATKWLMVSLLTEYNIFENALDAAKVRSSNIFLGHEITILDFIMGKPIFLLAALIFIFIISYGIITQYRMKDKIEFKKMNTCLLLIACMVPFWYMIMLNHSLEHCWFTWRSGVVSLLALLIYIYNVVCIKLKNII